jgi:tRNA-modifying protein YgfZ
MSETTNPDPNAATAPGFGATPVVGAYGEQVQFAAAAPGRLAAGFACPLTDAALMHAGGADALTFLHSQFTNDVEHLGEDEARRFGYCTPKGRLFATFLGWRADDGVTLVVSRTLLEQVRRRLSMYVLRAKVRVEDLSGAVALFGVGGDAAPAALAALGVAAPGPMRIARAGERLAAGLPAVEADGFAARRWLLCVPAADAAPAWSELSRALVPASTSLWRWTEVRAGVPTIVEATRERFVPQSVNLELVGALSFTKGCYPGQEIVARSQYLGKLKRRTFVAHVAGVEPAPGSDVLSTGGGEPCGEVVMAAPSPLGGFDLLFEARVEAVAAGTLSAGTEPLTLLPLPYEIPARD